MRGMVVWLALALAAGATAPPQTVTVALNAGSWTRVPLPFQVLTVAAQPEPTAPLLWAGGFHGELWRSGDEGRSWQRAYRGGDDDLVEAIEWLDGQHGIAAGSNRLWITTRDGGQHWRDHAAGPPGGIWRLAMADAEHGLAASPDAFWVRNGSGWFGRRFQDGGQVGGIAVLGRRRYVILDEPPVAKPGPHLIETSEDGGKTWSASRLAGQEPVHLAQVAGRLWLFGYSEGNSPARPSAAVNDGSGWRSAPAPAWFTACTGQGCLANDRSWVRPGDSPARYRWFPASGGESPWAASGETTCAVGRDGIDCVLTTVRATPPAPLGPPAAAALASTPERVNVRPARCRYCPAPRYPAPARSVGVQGEVVLGAIIGKSGEVKDLRLLSAPDAMLAKAAMQTASRWRYQPTLLKGKPVDVDTEITFDFLLAH